MVTVDIVWLAFAVCNSVWLTRNNPEYFKLILPVIYSCSFIPSAQIPVNMFIICGIVGGLALTIK